MHVNGTLGGDWQLFDDNPQLGIRRYRLDLGNGTSVQRTEHYVTEGLLDLNAERRSATASSAWGDGKMAASIPINVYYEQLAQAVKEGDQRYINKWLNDPDHAKFRTKEGRL